MKGIATMQKPNSCSKSIALLLLLSSALIITTHSTFAAVTTVGNVTNVTYTTNTTNNDLTVHFWINNGGEADVTAYADDTVRVQYYFSPLWSKEEPMIAAQLGTWPATAVTTNDLGSTYVIQTALLKIIITKVPFKVDFQDKNGNYDLLADDHMEFDSAYGYTGQRGTGASKIKCWKQVPSNQAFYGLGEFGGPLNRRYGLAGKDLECWAEGTYNWSEYNNPEYMNIPFYYGIQPVNGVVPSFVYGLFFDNPCRSLFSFGGPAANNDATKSTFQAGDGQMDYFFFGGGTNHTMASVVDRYSQLTGRPTMLPKWAMGHHLSRFSYWCQSWVQSLADAATSSNMPLDAVYLDIDYMDTDDNPNAFGPLQQLWLNPNADGNGAMCNHFPNSPAMVSYCGAKGVKIVPLIEPWLEPSDPLYNNASVNLDFIKDNNGNQVQAGLYVNSNVSWFDWTSTAGRNRWETNIMNWFTANGFGGIWNDTDEPESGDEIPYNGLLYEDGRYGTVTGAGADSRREWSNEHNYFGLRTAQTSYEALQKTYPNKRPFVLSRSGTAGIQRYAVSWSGDTDADWTYARDCIRFGISAMISGAGYFGHDLGGFTGTVNTQPELLERWYEWGALMPMYRSHSRKGDDNWPNGDQGREPWRFAEPYKSEMRTDIQFRYKLMPYLYTLMYNFTQTGQPMNVPTAFQFSADQNTTSLNDYEFLVGDYLMAAPVYTQGATTRTVYLPYAPGVQWYYYPNGTSSQAYNGGQTITVSAPLGTLPLFVRSGAIIPMGPSMQYMNQFQPTALDINCWPAGMSAFTMYEDAGDGWDFTNLTGRAQTPFTSVRGSNTWDFTIGARQGSYNPGSRSFYVYCYTPQNVTAITLNSSALTHYATLTDLTNNTSGWTMTSDSRLAIKVPGDTTAKAIHVDWTGGLPGSDLGLPGTWSGWDDITTPWLMTLVSPPGTPAAASWYTNSVHVASSGGDITQGTYQFKLRQAHDWSKNWGLNSAGNAIINGTTSLAWNGSTNVAITVSNGYYYSFRALQPTLSSSATIAVLQTSAKPVSVLFSGQTPTYPTSSDSPIISITLSGAKSAEEHIYVRWTTNNWATSQFTEATGSGTAYSATLPAMPNGTAVNYYILSSTATPSTGLTSATADQLTLSIDANSGNNYQYTASTIPWPGFGYPSDPAANIHHWKEEAVVGNGFMSVMLDQNGALYDIYFPSVGLRSGSDTANEGYRGPQNWPNCPSLDQEANGQMNLIAAMGGMAVPTAGTNSMYWLQNVNGTDYTDIGQQWDSDNTMVVYTSNRLNVAGSNIKVQQYDFVPAESALPVITDGTRTNRAVHVKRFLLTNNEAGSKSINFYWDANFNVKGDNAYDEMSFEGTVGGTNYSAMIVRDVTNRVVNGSWCGPDGYGANTGTEYDPAGSGNWAKGSSVYFATVMKLVTNAVTGAGSPADGSWRDFTAVDNQEGWIGKKFTIPSGQTVELDVMTVGSWDDFAGATGTYTFWSRPMIQWFYTNNMSSAQATTETYWSNWLSGGVTVNFPDPNYDRLFKRSLLVSKLHVDPISGGIIAGMHNGAYPFVWPRDGVYASVTFDRTGHTNESTAFYRWLNNAVRLPETWGTNSSYFFQKYTTDGKPVWLSPQVDETASVPWGMYYHYLATGDGAFLSNNWNLAYSSARASSGDATNNTVFLNYDAGTHLMWTWNVWEDKTNEHLYSNGSVVRGLQDAANIGDYVGQTVTAGVFRTRATDIKGNNSQGIVKRINDRVEPSDISHLGLAVPFEVFTPNDPLMTNVVEWLSGRQSAGSFTDDIVEHGGDVDGLVRRYNHKIGGEADLYWNGGPWFLASSWYGEYFARWQDYVGGKSLVDTNKVILDKLIAKLGPMGLAAEQIAHDTSEQLYPDFWLQTAWPNVWESHSTLVDQMMMFLDYKPLTNDTCAFAPKLPDGWPSVKFNNLSYKKQRFDVTVTESDPNSCDRYTRMDINKQTAGPLNVDVYLRIPPNYAYGSAAMVITNGAAYAPAFADYDSATGRVHIKAPLTTAAGNNLIAVTWNFTYPAATCPDDDWDHDGLSDSQELAIGSNPLNPSTSSDGILDGWKYDYFGTVTGAVASASADPDGDGLSNLQEFLTGTDPIDGASYFHATSVKPQGADVVVTWMGGGGTTNMLQYSTGTFNGSYTTNYVDIPPPVVMPLFGTSIITNQIDAGGANNLPARFYRIRLVP